MLKNAFIGQTTKPTDTAVSAALGPAKAVWDEFLATLIAAHGATATEWKTHSVKWGWSLRVVRKQRTIVWLSPGSGGFNVAFILGAKAMQAARATKFPQHVVRVLETAPKYPEGTGVRLVVKSARSLPTLKKLAAVKVAS